MIKATFFMEQHIGHRAYYENLRAHIDPGHEIDPDWIEVSYVDENSPWQRVRFVPAGLRGTAIGRNQVRQGLKKNAQVLFFNTQVPAVLGNHLKRPYLIATDITPVQYDRMGAAYGHRSDRSRLVRSLKQWANQRVFREAAYLLPWSNWTASSLRADYGIDPALIEVLPPGVDLNTWRPAASPVSRPAQSPIRILFVGGDFERKGGLKLLQAFRGLPATLRQEIELVVVTRSQVPALPGLRVYSDLVPNSPDLIRLYQSCQIFVLPTLAEAFGIAAVEASSVGLPVIASKLGGLEDVVEDGVTGYLIEPGNMLRLQEKILMLAQDQALRQHMGQVGRCRVERYFDASKNAARLIEVIGSIVASQ